MSNTRCGKNYLIGRGDLDHKETVGYGMELGLYFKCNGGPRSDFFMI